MINIIKFFDSISVFRLEFLSDIRICLILVVFHGPLGVALGGQTVLIGSETSFEYFWSTISIPTLEIQSNLLILWEFSVNMVLGLGDFLNKNKLEPPNMSNISKSGVITRAVPLRQKFPSEAKPR